MSSTPQAWRPKLRASSVLSGPPPAALAESPSASARVSVGYDSDRVSTPDDDKTSSSTHALSTSSSHMSDESFRSSLVRGIESKALITRIHTDGSCGGTYWVRSSAEPHTPVAVFKPADEEIGQEGNPHGNTESERDEHFTPGTGYKREVLAYLLDHEHSAGVPRTVELTLHGKVGSAQYFVNNCTEAADHLPGKFLVDEVHRIALLDLRLLNGDRHGGNILVSSSTHQTPNDDDSHQRQLVPIDHSYVAPSGFCDPEFEWMMWPQVKIPFSDDIKAYVARLDPVKDRDVVLDVLHDEEAAELVHATTIAIQIAVSHGYTAKQIACWFRRETLTQPSELESALGNCRKDLDQGGDLDLEAFSRIVREAFPILSTSS